MLQIQNINKEYITGELVQTALDNVTLNLRENEFVAVLGPSGSGKTTLLNIIGGLDRYDNGDLIINGISTKKYKERDWDSYRNHTIGFVFQTYNLIPHQTVLANVELALTISGIPKAERRKRAKEALVKVGLEGHFHKKPNQMSGGQMQRVAIARALVNDPDIVLADEPTGALDTETSVQVMELLKEVADDRLVVMVTHNPELAGKYATRIIKLRDGRVQEDSNPCEADIRNPGKPEHKNMGKSSMSFLTSLSLSFNNLKTKKGRTLLTAFAGSIGIIGIALIMAVSNGVNAYIADIQKSTMTSYPISLETQAIDISSMLQAGRKAGEKASYEDTGHKLDAVYSNGRDIERISSITTSITDNNLTDFKKYIDNPDSAIHKYVGENGIVFSYDTKFDIYTYDPDGTLVNTDGSTLNDEEDTHSGNMIKSIGGMEEMSGFSGNFEEIMPGNNGKGISPAVTENYDVLYGSWPEKYNEVLLVLDKNNEISTSTLYELGILPSAEYKKLLEKIENREAVETKNRSFDYEEICKQKLYMIPACDYYEKNNYDVFDYIGDDKIKLKGLLKDAVELKITAVVRPKEDSETDCIKAAVGYTKDLTDFIINYTNQSDLVQLQRASKSVNVLNNMAFDPFNDAEKIKNAKTYLTNLGVTDKARLCREMLNGVAAEIPASSSRMAAIDEKQLAAALDNYLEKPEDNVLLSIYDNYISAGNYDDNMDAFGVVSLEAPSAINIYTDSFEAKNAISDCINNYNKSAKEEDQVIYTDYVGMLMSSVTTIVNVISYVLIAFVAVSLIVSSIMIGIITYISVLERTKEIGILRAIGASRHNISQVFNAETFIIGLCSGLLGIGITLLLLIPGNEIIYAVAETRAVKASLPFANAITLILLSLILTLTGGFIPSKKAAKKDPVSALRTE